MITNAVIPNIFNIEGEQFKTPPTMKYCDFVSIMPYSKRNKTAKTKIINCKIIWFQCLN